MITGATHTHTGRLPLSATVAECLPDLLVRFLKDHAGAYLVETAPSREGSGVSGTLSSVREDGSGDGDEPLHRGANQRQRAISEREQPSRYHTEFTVESELGSGGSVLPPPRSHPPFAALSLPCAELQLRHGVQSGQQDRPLLLRHQGDPAESEPPKVERKDSSGGPTAVAADASAHRPVLRGAAAPHRCALVPSARSPPPLMQVRRRGLRTLNHIRATMMRTWTRRRRRRKKEATAVNRGRLRPVGATSKQKSLDVRSQLRWATRARTRTRSSRIRAPSRTRAVISSVASWLMRGCLPK